MNAHPTWMLGGRPLPHIEDEAREIDFSASCVIDTASHGGAWAQFLELGTLPPWIERIPHSQSSSVEAQDNHAA